MMATIKRREGKTGVSYLIRTYSGYDGTGKQVEKTMTWRPLPGMTEKQIEKAINEAAVIFERKVKDGIILDGGTRFSDFATRWMDEYGATQLAPKTMERYKALLVRINQAIGNIRLDKLRPDHLQKFYKNLGEDGIKSTGSTATCVADLTHIIKSEKGVSKVKVAEHAGVAPVTVTSACQGKRISLTSAQAIAKALEYPVEKLFKIEKEHAPLSDKTIQHHHRLISSILQTAVQWQIIYDNPARRVKPPKVERKEAVWLEDTEAQKVVEALASAPIKWRTAILLLLHSGIRRGELCGLEWSDIDFENNLIHIQRASQYVVGMGVIEKDTKNFSSVRVIKLDTEIMEVLQQYKIWQTEQILLQGDRWHRKIPIKDAHGKVSMQKNERLFTQENGLPINPDSVTDWVKKFREKNSLPQFTPHTLRHTNISLLIAAGIPLRNVASRAGHANLTSISKTYAHAIKTVDEKAASAIGDILNPAKMKKA